MGPFITSCSMNVAYCTHYSKPAMRLRLFFILLLHTPPCRPMREVLRNISEVVLKANPALE